MTLQAVAVHNTCKCRANKKFKNSGVLLESDQSLIIRVEVGPGAFLILVLASTTTSSCEFLATLLRSNFRWCFAYHIVQCIILFEMDVITSTEINSQKLMWSIISIISLFNINSISIKWFIQYQKINQSTQYPLSNNQSIQHQSINQTNS